MPETPRGPKSVRCPPDSQITLSVTVAPASIVLCGKTLTPAPMMASSLAHELGHYLGLYHVKEDGTVLQDQIPDTIISDSGPTNLMYPQRNNDPTITRFFSKQQAEVMMGHPAVVPALRR